MLLPFRSSGFGVALALAAVVSLETSNRAAAHPHHPGMTGNPYIVHRPPVMNAAPRPVWTPRSTPMQRPIWTPRPTPVQRPVWTPPVTPMQRRVFTPQATPMQPMTRMQPATPQSFANPAANPLPVNPRFSYPVLLNIGLTNPGYYPGYPGFTYPGYPGVGYYGGGPGGPGGILNTLANMLPGQAGYAQQTPGMSPTGRFYMYDTVTGSGVLSGSLPIVNQFAGVAGINYGGGYAGPNPNFSLLPPGVALNVAYNTLPGIPMTQAPMAYGLGFGNAFGFGYPFGFGNGLGIGFGNGFGFGNGLGIGFGNGFGFGNGLGIGFGNGFGGFGGKVGFGNGNYGL